MFSIPRKSCSEARDFCKSTHLWGRFHCRKQPPSSHQPWQWKSFGGGAGPWGDRIHVLAHSRGYTWYLGERHLEARGSSEKWAAGRREESRTMWEGCPGPPCPSSGDPVWIGLPMALLVPACPLMSTPGWPGPCSACRVWPQTGSMCL